MTDALVFDHSDSQRERINHMFRGRGMGLVLVLASVGLWSETATRADEMSWIEVSKDKRSFSRSADSRSFVPWGVNYDHDADGRLLEDYWETKWADVEGDFREIKSLGANVVRIHLQVGKFLSGPRQPNEKALAQLAKLVALAEREKLYLDLTGLGCYHKKDVPEWYDALSEAERWQAQATFWRAVAKQCEKSPAIFCYDLMNEPVVPGGRRKEGDWLGPAFGDKHFVQVITLDQMERPRPEIARQWIHTLVAAIREVDRRHLVTVGLVDWSLDRPGLTSGFVPDKVADELDFLCIHLYPESGKLDEQLATLKGFAAVGKPLVIEETFPLKCSPMQMTEFLERSREHACGWISFYWGKPVEELRKSSSIGDAILAQWLVQFQKLGPTMQSAR